EINEAGKNLFHRIYKPKVLTDERGGFFRQHPEYLPSARILGNNFLKAIQPGRSELEKAAKAIVKEGWPAKREAWQVRFEIKEIPAGTVEYKNDKRVTTTEKTFAVRTKGGKFWGRAYYGGFKTREEAIDAAKKLAEKDKRVTQREESLDVEKLSRKGPPRRPEGLDVQPKDL